MKKALVIALLSLFSAPLLLVAAPTEDQLDAVARNPRDVASVLSEASSNEDKAAALADIVARIEQSERTDQEKTQAIALLAAESVVWLEGFAPEVIGLLVSAVGEDRLPVITSAAVYSAGPRSPEVFKAIMAAAGTTRELRDLIEKAARNPTATLGPAIVATLPRLTMTGGAGTATSAIASRDVTLLPEVGPERRPARRYRGQ